MVSLGPQRLRQLLYGPVGRKVCEVGVEEQEETHDDADDDDDER